VYADREKPTLTPLLLVAQKRLSFKQDVSSSFSFWFLVSSYWSSISIAFFCTFTLSDNNIKGSVVSSLGVLAQYIVYVAFLPRIEASSRLVPHINDIEDAIVLISWRTLLMLTIVTGIHVNVYGLMSVNVTQTILLGFAKAFSWYFVTRIVCTYVCEVL
jgi:hypothetical protein